MGVQALAGGPTAVAGPLSTTQNARLGDKQGFDVHDLVDEASERLDARLGLIAPEDLRPVHVPGGQVRQGAGVLVVNALR